jgi:hypothetical protein
MLRKAAPSRMNFEPRQCGALGTGHFLHDGRTSNLEEAILAHASHGSEAGDSG